MWFCECVELVQACMPAIGGYCLLLFVRQNIEEKGKLYAWQNQTSLQNTTLKHGIKQVLIDNVNEIDDEYHYILMCPFFNEQRKTFLKKNYYTRPNTLKWQQLMSSSSTAELSNLCKLIIHMNKLFKR